MRSYRKFIGYLGDTLIETLRVMEDEGWHHELNNELSATYLELARVLDEVGERAKFYVNEKGGTGEARVAARRLLAAEDSLDRLLASSGSRSLVARDSQLELDSDLGSKAWSDGNQDAD